MKRTAKIALTSAAGIERGAWLVVDEGSEHAEMAYVLRVRGRAVTIVSAPRWRDKAGDLLRQTRALRRPRVLRRRVRSVLCVPRGHLRGHRFEEDGALCWCGERVDRAWLDDGDEDGG